MTRKEAQTLLDSLYERLEYYRSEKAITAYAPLNFDLKKRIEDLEEQIQNLRNLLAQSQAENIEFPNLARLKKMAFMDLEAQDKSEFIKVSYSFLKDCKNVVKDSVINAKTVHIGDKIYNNGKHEIKRLLTPPPFQTPIFIGRKEELETVHDRLFGGENFLMLVNGQGGIGKTTFAAKYWERYQNDYSHLAFLYVEDGIANAILRLAPQLGLTFEKQSQAEQLEMLITVVSNLDKPCLLILDNANAEQDLNDNVVLLRRCNNFHILLTSRLADFEHAQKYPLGTLDKKQALELFKRHYALLSAQEEATFKEIYKSVGGNTLILELMAKNLTNFNNKLKQRYTLEQLKDDLQEGLTKLSHSKEVKVKYQAKGTGLREETPEAIILAMYDLTELSDAETALLSVFAVLPAENIAFETLENMLKEDPQILQLAELMQQKVQELGSVEALKEFLKQNGLDLSDEEIDKHLNPKIVNFDDLDQTLLTLSQKGWLEYNEDESSFKVSPVVQEITRHKNQHRLYADCEKMIRFLAEKLHPVENPNYHQENYKYSTLYSRYAESVVSYFTEPHINFLMLCERIGSFYQTTGNLSQALHFYKKYENLAQKLV
ncbi:MAG: hypothetical protein JJT94_04545, partial [Bernardetiaceae bacterium]|nr:hypothetical protein [Bernardetiaceae bacterium]